MRVLIAAIAATALLASPALAAGGTGTGKGSQSRAQIDGHKSSKHSHGSSKSKGAAHSRKNHPKAAPAQ